MDDFRLRIFDAVVKEGSFSRAGLKLGITQAAVSQNIAELEKQAGYRLLFRERGKVSLTDHGRLFYNYAENILSGYYALSAVFSENDGIYRHIRTGISEILGSDFAAGLTSPLSVSGKYRIEISMDQLQEAELNVTAHRMGSILPEHGDIAGVSPVCAVVSAASPYAHIRPSSFRDMPDMTLAVCSGILQDSPDIRETCCCSSSPDVIISAVTSSVEVVGVVPLCSVQKKLADRSVVSLPAIVRPELIQVVLSPSAEFAGTHEYKIIRHQAGALLEALF